MTAVLSVLLMGSGAGRMTGQTPPPPPPPPSVVDTSLAVRTVASGLNQPVNMAFIGRDEFLITEKASGQVKRILNGAVAGVALDLPVNSASERGLLGIALHPRFKQNNWVYLYWTESSTGADSNLLPEVGNPNSPFPPGTPRPLGNRVDRFVWDKNSHTLAFDRNIITLRAYQEDAGVVNGVPGPQQRGNHDGGVIRFGSSRDELGRSGKRGQGHGPGHGHGGDDDEEGEETPGGDSSGRDSKSKLYIYIGDAGRRGQMQNLPDGPGCLDGTCAIPSGNLADDQFGGPEPDNAHLTGVILRLNDDGTTPDDNPFFKAGAKRGGEAGTNLQKVFAYGIRNGVGMAVDPYSGRLWEAQNGDDTFTEINQVNAGANLGWVQVMGPMARIGEFKSTETSQATDPVTGGRYFGLQQLRWPPTNIADSPDDARARLFMVYEDGKKFGAALTGGQELPAVDTSAKAVARFELKSDGSIEYELRAMGPIVKAVASHIHLGARAQNGPVAAFLFQSATPVDFQPGDLIAKGTLTGSSVIARDRFEPTIASLVERMRQGRAYVNLHTTTVPSGEIRGQVVVTDRRPVSHYSDPEFSWRYEVAPGAVGFVSSASLGREYRGNLIVGAATPRLLGGHLFRFKLTGNRRDLSLEDPRLGDRVADNKNKYDITESESLLFGSNFGAGTDIQTGPNGNLYVVSLSNGAVYEIYRVQ